MLSLRAPRSVVGALRRGDIMPRPLYSWERTPVTTEQETGWAPERSGRFGDEKGNNTRSGRCVGLTTLPPPCADFLEILGASPFWSLKGLCRPVSGLLYVSIFIRNITVEQRVHILNVTTRWCCWLRLCATSREVAGSISDGVTGMFH
jgi:hypothetical protein